MTLGMWDMACLKGDSMVNATVPVLGIYLLFLQHVVIFPSKRDHLTECNIGMIGDIVG